jgi:hypothetical protein
MFLSPDKWDEQATRPATAAVESIRSPSADERTSRILADRGRWAGWNGVNFA